MSRILVAVVAGLVVATLVVLLVARKGWRSAASGAVNGGGRPTSRRLGWASLVLGLVTVAGVVIGLLTRPSASPGVEQPSEGFDPQSLLLVALGTGLAAAVTAAVALRRGDRGWQVLTGLGVGAIVIGTWVAVIIYIMANPY